MAIGTLGLYVCVGPNAAEEVYINDNHASFLASDTSSTNISLSPIPIPGNHTDINYSYAKYLRWKLLTPPDNYIKNVKVYGPATAPATGVVIRMGSSHAGATPVNSSVTGLVWQYLNYTTGQTGLKLSIATPSNQLATAGAKTWYCIVQLRCTASASQGNSAYTPFNIVYDEV
jgi:hypothetical protein